MNIVRQRAAIYTCTISHHTQEADDVQEMLLDTCRQYCQQQGYQLAEKELYQGESFFGNAPELVQLRLLVVQRQLDVLVIPRPECLGSLPLWNSLPTANTIDAFYRHQVRIESVIKRHGVHNIYQQMLLDGIHVIKQRKAGDIEKRFLNGKEG